MHQDATKASQSRAKRIFKSVVPIRIFNQLTGLSPPFWLEDENPC